MTTKFEVEVGENGSVRVTGGGASIAVAVKNGVAVKTGKRSVFRYYWPGFLEFLQRPAFTGIDVISVLSISCCCMFTPFQPSPLFFTMLAVWKILSETHTEARKLRDADVKPEDA